MPYSDGLGAAIAAPKPSLALLVAKARMAQAARQATLAKVFDKSRLFHRKPLKSKHDGFPGFTPLRPMVTPVLKLPSVGPAVVPVSPETVVTAGVPHSASGGGPVSSGAPSPIMSTVPEEQAVDDGSAPAQAGMSPVVMLLLAGTAVAFLLKKKR